MTKYNFLILVFLPFCLFADCADCQAYKTQVVNDCDSLHSLIQSSLSDISSIVLVSQNGANSTLGSTQGNDQLSNAYFNSIRSTSDSLNSTLNSLDTFVTSIRSTAQSLQCNVSSNTVGSCDCSQYLQTLIGLVQTCNQTVSGISSGLDSVRVALGTASPDFNTVIVTLNNTETNILELLLIVSSFLGWDDGELPYTISEFYSLFSDIGNNITNFNGSVTLDALMSYRFMPPSFVPSTINYSALSPFASSASTVRQSTLKNIIYLGFRNLLKQGSSLNNYAYSNINTISSIHDFLPKLTNTVDISSITNLLEEKFTIFNPSSPLEIYTQGSEQNYYQFLTNYYIKVSTGGPLSPSEPHTNWFSRIEMLLASLVFKDEGTNFVDNAENTSELENTLSQSVDTLSQAVSVPQNVTGKIDNMGKSFLDLLGEWNAIVSGNSLPSQFVLCDINLQSERSENTSSSVISSFRLETSLDSGAFRQFLDYCHAVTTIIFTMLFVYLSIHLLTFLLICLAKLVQFCYLVYSALFGG